MTEAQFTPSLAAGETGPILQRHLLATAGPWVSISDPKQPGAFICPVNNVDRPICFAFESIAENSNFLLHAWHDQKRLLATVLRYKGIFGELARQIRTSSVEDDGEGNLLFIAAIPGSLLIQLEEMAKL